MRDSGIGVVLGESGAGEGSEPVAVLAWAGEGSEPVAVLAWTGEGSESGAFGRGSETRTVLPGGGPESGAMGAGGPNVVRSVIAIETLTSFPLRESPASIGSFTTRAGISLKCIFFYSIHKQLDGEAHCQPACGC